MDIIDFTIGVLVLSFATIFVAPILAVSIAMVIDAFKGEK